MEVDSNAQPLACQPENAAPGAYRTVIRNLAPFMFFFLLMLVLHQSLSYVKGDDLAFAQAHTQASLVDFLKTRYSTWSGRLASDACLYLVLAQPLALWRLLNSLALTLLCFLYACFVCGARFWRFGSPTTHWGVWGVVSSLGLINFAIARDGIFWITGSINYLWPLTACAAALLPFYERYRSAPRDRTALLFQAAALPAALYAGLGNEQVALVFAALLVVANLAIWRKQPARSSYLLALTAVGLACCLALLAAPGNQARLAQETANSYPNFGQLSLKLKVFLGLVWTLHAVVNLNRTLLVVVYGLLALHLWLDGRGRLDRGLAIVSVIFVVFLTLALIDLGVQNKTVQTWLQDYLFNFDYLAKSIRGEALPRRITHLAGILTPYIIWLPALAGLPFGLWRGVRRGHFAGWMYALLFSLGIGVLLGMSFSPTIYVSGTRTIFVFSALLWLIALLLLQAIQERLPRPLLAGGYLFGLAALVVNFWALWNQSD